MINKTFNSDSTDGRALEVGRNGERTWLNIREFDLENTMFILAPSDAPALALAILEAAGGRDALGIDVGNAMIDLHECVSEQERANAEAKEQEELEAEALELFNTSRLERGLDELDWVRVTPRERAEWLAVARRAREIAEAKAAGE